MASPSNAGPLMVSLLELKNGPLRLEPHSRPVKVTVVWFVVVQIDHEEELSALPEQPESRCQTKPGVVDLLERIGTVVCDDDVDAPVLRST